MAQAKKTQIETQKINAELNHKSALNELHDAFSAFATQMYPYFEETCKVSGLKYNDPQFLEGRQPHGQEGSANIVENLTTGDADINHATKYFQNPTFMSAVTDKLLECIQ